MLQIDSRTRSPRRKRPPAFISLVLGVNLFVSVVVIAYPLAAGALSNLCLGQYPCYTAPACQKAGGDFMACPDKCTGSGTQGYCYTKQEPIPIKISIGGESTVIDIGDYISKVYRYAVGVAAVVAATMMMVGGLQYVISAGGSQKESGKKRIINGVVGLLLTIFAYTILNTINPSLVRLQMPRIPMVKKVEFVKCDEFKMRRPCGEQFGLKEKQNVEQTAAVTARYDIVPVTDPDMLTECVGASCSPNDATQTCQRGGASAASPATSSTQPSGTQQASTSSSGYQCRACVADAQDCTGIGANASCCGKYCGFPDDPSIFNTENWSRWWASMRGQAITNYQRTEGICTNGVHGSQAAIAEECYGGKLVDVTRYWNGISSLYTASNPLLATIAGGTCTNGTVGAPCNADSDCSGMRCLDWVGAHVCSPTVIGGACDGQDYCPNGAICQEGVCVPSSSMVELEDIPGLEGMTSSSQPISTARVGSFDPAPGVVCRNDSDCRRGSTVGYCYDGALYTPGTHSGICTAGQDGNGCDGPEDCISGACYNFGGAGKACLGPYDTAGSPCEPTAGGQGGCGTGLRCDAGAKICIQS